MRDSDSGDPPITSSSRALQAVVATERSRSDLDNIARRSGGSLRRTAPKQSRQSDDATEELDTPLVQGRHEEVAIKKPV